MLVKIRLAPSLNVLGFFVPNPVELSGNVASHPLAHSCPKKKRAPFASQPPPLPTWLREAAAPPLLTPSPKEMLNSSLSVQRKQVGRGNLHPVRPAGGVVRLHIGKRARFTGRALHIAVARACRHFQAILISHFSSIGEEGKRVRTDAQAPSFITAFQKPGGGHPP